MYTSPQLNAHNKKSFLNTETLNSSIPEHAQMSVYRYGPTLYMRQSFGLLTKQVQQQEQQKHTKHPPLKITSFLMGPKNANRVHPKTGWDT